MAAAGAGVGLDESVTTVSEVPARPPLETGDDRQFEQFEQDHKHDGLFCAASMGSLDFVNRLIAKGEEDWNHALRGAASGGHRGLANLFIAKGANNWVGALRNAEEGGHFKLAAFFKQKQREQKIMPCGCQLLIAANAIASHAFKDGRSAIDLVGEIHFALHDEREYPRPYICMIDKHTQAYRCEATSPSGCSYLTVANCIMANPLMLCPDELLLAKNIHVALHNVIR